MNWFRAHHGLSADKKFLRIMTKTGANGAEVLGVWVALLDHAGQADPRGSVSSFDHEDYAEFARMKVERVTMIVAAFRERGMIDASGAIAKWGSRQKSDPGAADRMRRYRARQKKKDQEAEPEAGESTPRESCDSPESGVTERNGYGRDASRDLEEREQSSLSSEASTGTGTTTGYEARNACAPAQDFFTLAGWLRDQGVDATLVKAGWNRSTIATWQARGITKPQMLEAVSRAKQQLAANGDTDRAIPIKYLDPFVGEVLAGVPRRAPSNRTRSQGYEATDRNLAEYVARSR